MSTFAVVPVKNLQRSKTRLSSVFSFQERSHFTMAMLEDVLSALKSSEVDRVIIVSSDSNVKKFVKDSDTTFLEEKTQGLNQALNQATEWCMRNSAESVLVLPADVPLVTSKDINQLVKLVRKNSMVISPSQNGGTNALLQSPLGIVSFCFGSDSFKKHLGKALAENVQVKIYASASLLLDIDSETDFEQLLKMGEGTVSYRFLKQSSWVKTCQVDS